MLSVASLNFALKIAVLAERSNTARRLSVKRTATFFAPSRTATSKIYRFSNPIGTYKSL